MSGKEVATENSLYFRLEGDIDDKAAAKLKEEFHASDLSAVQEVVFDFHDVTYIGSAGIGKLLLFYKYIVTRGGTIKLTNVPEQTYETFRILRLNTIFTITR
jgi:anti-anti-sigma factor